MRQIWVSRWRDSLLLIPPLIIVGWFTYGFVLSDELFDKHLGQLSVLTSIETILGYVGLLFAVQIPVFILLLEKMYDAGYIRRLSLPSVIQFREILISYAVLSLLLLLSPRASYYYFPVAGLTLLSIYAIVESIRVMFETRKLKEREDKYIRTLVKKSLKASMSSRVGMNNFFAEISDLLYVTHATLDAMRNDKNSDKRYPIRIDKVGIIESIDVKKLNDLIVREYYSEAPKVTGGKPTGEVSDKEVARIVLNTRPSASVRSQDEVIKLVLANDLDMPSKRFVRNLLSCIKSVADHPDSPNRQMDDLIKDFKQQLRGSIEKDDEVAVDDALNIYELLTDGLTTLHSSDDPGYNFKAAQGEFNQLFRDSVSNRLQDIADIIDDAFYYALRTERQDAVKIIVSSMYKSLLNSFNSFDVLEATRAERAFTHAISRLVYSDDTEPPSTHYKEDVLQSLAFRLKEHTGLLLYNYRGYDESLPYTKEQLTQWLNSRLSSSVSLLLGAYKKSRVSMFGNIKTIFDEIEDDYDLYGEEIEEFIWPTRSMLFLVAAYIHGKSNLTKGQKEIRQELNNYLSNFSAQELTRILVECIDDDYAKKWRFDTHDLVADGRVHGVPDFNINLQSLWVDRMLALESIPKDIKHYGRDFIAQTGAFSDLMTKKEEAFILRHLSKLGEEGQDVSALSSLVDSFISERTKFENTKLADTLLDQDIITEFKKEVLEGYEKSALALSVFKQSGRLKLLKAATKGLLSYGWNQIHDKYGFIKGWHIGVAHQAHSYGRQIAHSENKHIVETLLSKPSSQIDDFETWLKRLRRSKKQSWFIISVRVSEWHMIFSRKDDIGKHIIEDHSRGGVRFKDLKQISPVHHTYEDSLPKGLYAIPVDDLGKLEIKGNEDEPVKVSIDAYSHDNKMLNAIIKSPPDWLKDKGGADTQKAFLKTQVRMLIQHPFKYTPVSKPSIYYHPVTDKDSD